MKEKDRNYWEKNKVFHKNILSNLKTNYFEPLFQKYNKQWQDIDLRVKLPPEIPAQENNHDCGVFLLMFAKCIVMKLAFDFNTENMIKIRDTIREEINAGKTTENIIQGTPRKRKGRTNNVTTKKMKNPNVIQCPQRRIINLDAAGFLLNLFSKFGGPKIRIFGGNSEGFALNIRL